MKSSEFLPDRVKEEDAKVWNSVNKRGQPKHNQLKQKKETAKAEKLRIKNTGEISGQTG
jgi:hypothetical protein